MEEKDGFVENTKIAIKGIGNGIFGSIIYELLLYFLVSMIVMMAVASKNPNATQDELNNLVNNVFDSFSFNIIIGCLVSFITLIVFVYIIEFSKFKQLCKKAINLKTLKYGIIGSLCIMGFSIIYNSSIISIFNLDNTGNSNQESVVGLIKSNVFFGFMSVVVFAPIVEELTYRYCLFGAIAKKRKRIGYLVSAIVFGLMHGISSVMEYGFGKELLSEMLYLPPYLFSGLALCYLYDKSENLGSSVIAHMINNLISFLGVICL